MRNFFLNQNNYFVIELFSIFHFLLILITFLLVMLVIKNKEFFKRMNDKNKILLRYILIIILLINFILRRGSFIYYDVYNWRYHLDINFCNFTSIMFLIYGFTGNKKVYNLCYYMAFVGPLLSIILPSTSMKPLTYSFYSFLILHHIIFIFNLIFMFMENKEYNKKDFYNIMIFLVIYMFVVYIFNFIMKTDYNMPLTFVNVNLFKNIFLQYLLNIIYIENLLMFFIIFILINLGKQFLKYFNK